MKYRCQDILNGKNGNSHYTRKAKSLQDTYPPLVTCLLASMQRPRELIYTTQPLCNQTIETCQNVHDEAMLVFTKT